MRGGVVALLVLIAAFAGPVRLACGTTCVSEPSAPVTVALAPASDAACHKPEHPPQPVPEPEAEHCRHDHSASIRPASRGLIADVTLQPELFEPPAITGIADIQLVAAAPPSRLPPSWPPIRIVPLRI